jgi:hypothetical protein
MIRRFTVRTGFYRGLPSLGSKSVPYAMNRQDFQLHLEPQWQLNSG